MRHTHVCIAIVACSWLMGCDKIPGTDAYLIKQAEPIVTANLRDPYAAQFRNERVVAEYGGEKIVCGDVNAKNIMGNYIGFRPFYFKTPSDHEIQPDEVRPSTQSFGDDQIRYLNDKAGMDLFTIQYHYGCEKEIVRKEIDADKSAKSQGADKSSK